MIPKSQKKLYPGARDKTRSNRVVSVEMQSAVRPVDSLYDSIQDGREYVSIVDAVPKPNVDLFGEIIRGIGEIENVRGRPCILYAGNVVRRDDPQCSIDSTDDLPFIELVNSVPKHETRVDVFLSTVGGSAHQVSRFVNCLRARFSEVDFLIPSFCMSAGTIFALSGDRIWMTDRACLGPIDPQVPTSAGRFVPAQALLLLVAKLEQDGHEARKKGGGIPWTSVRIIDSLDKKELGDAITASQYSITMAAQFLMAYKFRNWMVREASGIEVTPEYRADRALEIANALASHERWKNHGHAIPRDVLWHEIQLKIDHPDADFNRAVVRLWALMNWLFDKTGMLKALVAKDFRYMRHKVQQRGASSD